MDTNDNINTVKPIPQFKAFVQAKCPRCRRGDMFANGMYNLSGQNMHKHCPHCNMSYEREPGYFYVAMFVSYAMNVAEMVTAAVITHTFTGSMDPWLYLGVLFGVIILLSPFNFRYSRVMLLYWLTPGLRYRPELSGDIPGKKAS